MSSTDKRKKILQALEKVLKNRRFDEITVDEVAAAAGVGKGTVYRYFQDKEDLFFQMVQDNLKDEFDKLVVFAASVAPARDKLVRVAERMSENIQKHSSTVRMMHAPQFARKRPGAREMMHEHHRRLDRALGQIFDECEDAGVMRKGCDRAAALCVYKGAVMERSISLVHGGADVPIESVVDMVLQGLGQPD